MGRPAGSRNRDYEASRHALASRLGPHLLRNDGEPATVADLAVAAEVSATTLKHYFTDRDGIFAAVMQAVYDDSRGYLDAAGEPGTLTVAESVSALLHGLVVTWRDYGLGRVFASGLALGTAHELRGPAFLGSVLEPLTLSVEHLLTVHVERGDLPGVDVRAVALGLLGPVVLALLHQDCLGGRVSRPLDTTALINAHVATMVSGLSAAAGS